ncbi:MAG: adenosylcobinamide-GDP ribazoletransferase [Bacteroidaceae bacterium]|nr:adenosylcobinamide-GDP ribazoletransferase [Bacteroidaceae bacterium]
MQITISFLDRPLAAFIFFTRLPFWRLRQPPKECYVSVVEYWPLTGWLTGGLMAATLWLGSQFLPYIVAVVLAVATRMLLTGALHEDGLADFFDGFGGGGRDRNRILAIMKDSHIGTYGVLALVVYVLLLIAVLASLPLMVAVFAIIVGDPLAKMLAAQLVTLMPYARSQEEAKNKTVYRRFTTGARISLAVQGLLPLACWVLFNTQCSTAQQSRELAFAVGEAGANLASKFENEVSMFNAQCSMLLILPALVMFFLYLFIWHRLRGYTGDCCGAVCLMVELSFYLMLNAQSSMFNV